jgi:murein L,D-transpeptidase YcbB/YkuD
MTRHVLLAAAAVGTTLLSHPVRSADAQATAPASATQPAAARVDSILGVDARLVTLAIRECLARPHPEHLPAAHWEHARRLYAAHDNRSLWFAANGLDEARVRGLLRALIDASTDGLRLEEYALAEIAGSVAAMRGARRPAAAEIAALDVLLSGTYIALASDLLSGQFDPRSLSQAWHVHLAQERLDSAVARAVREEPLDSAIASMRPSDENYAALRRELLRLRAVVAAGGWPEVPPGRVLSPGDREDIPRLAAVRRRLLAAGHAVRDTMYGGTASANTNVGVAGDGSSEGVYDDALAGAVARFQERHGLEADSVLGERTLAAMNVSATHRLGQIASNLERHRWFPRSLGDRYILVNVPAFRLEAFDAGRKVLEMKVIVGREYQGRRTPIFADSMEYVVFRPYWIVPPGIRARDIEPRIARDPGFLAANGFEYFVENGQRFVRQRPGGSNALGLVKFIFPNDFNVYLHDTPDTALFRQDVRAFSSGCIRVEQPAVLARWVLGRSAERVRQAERGADDYRVMLPRKLAVYIAYFTAYVRNGELHFGNDLYSRDHELVRTVAAGALPSVEMSRAVDLIRALVD